MSDNLERLEQLTSTLVHLPEITRPGNGHIVIYDVPQGSCIGIGLLKLTEIAIQQSFASAGTIFPRHDHAEVETLSVYSGRMTVVVNGTSHELTVGDTLTIPPNMPHRVDVAEDTWLIGQTIPGSPDYPSSPA